MKPPKRRKTPAKRAVMQPKFKLQVVRDRTKYNRKDQEVTP